MNTENVEVMDQVADTDIDSAWADDDDFASVPVESSDDEPAAETPAEPNVESAPAVEEQPAADQPKMFTLKNRDATRQVTEQELVSMAQKGWDYDTVRQERDQLRQYRGEADPALALVKDYAARLNMTVPQYIDHCRKEELKAKGMTEQQAAHEVQQQNREADLRTREAAIAAKEQQQNSVAQRAKAQEEARRNGMREFMTAYPNVKPDAIPKEVWSQVAKGVPMITAYTMSENARLKAENAALQQNKINQASAPGSLHGNSVTDQDEIDRIWAEDD